MRKEATEKEIENTILQFLSYMPGMFWKNQTVGVWDQTRKTYRKPKNRYHLNGVSDILGIISESIGPEHGGKFVAIEVKRPSTKKRLTPAQKAFIENIQILGGIAFVATSLDDVKEQFQKLGINAYA